MIVRFSHTSKYFDRMIANLISTVSEWHHVMQMVTSSMSLIF